VYVPASDLAKEEGLLAGANVLMLAIYSLSTSAITIETLRMFLPKSIKKKHLVEKNLKLLDCAVRFYRENLQKN
jgi:Pyruvate/2-oxoacid:ferredoxin oxidoreductase gamma subunit